MSSDFGPVAELDASLTPAQRAYLVALVEAYNHKSRAAEAAGISVWTPRRWKNGYAYLKSDERIFVPPNPAYIEALEVAEELAAQRIEDVAIQRAVEGRRSYKFHARTGDPLRHPISGWDGMTDC